MSVWEKHTKEEREEYIRFLQVYGALTNLFRQKHGDPIPYLDSKFQETIYAKIFKGENVDIGNTPHDILSVFGNERIGIGLKTWMNSKPSFQKVLCYEPNGEFGNRIPYFSFVKKVIRFHRLFTAINSLKSIVTNGSKHT